jgi:hypothetical protein
MPKSSFRQFVGAGFYSKVFLEEGERATLSMSAFFARDKVGSSGGNLYLTTRRLIFTPRRWQRPFSPVFWKPWLFNSVSIELADISACDAQSRGNATLPPLPFLPLKAIVVSTQSGETYCFWPGMVGMTPEQLCARIRPPARPSPESKDTDLSEAKMVDSEFI